MSALSKNAQALPVNGALPGGLDNLILARIACSGGATRAQIIRDLGPIVTGKISAAQWRTIADTTLAKLMMAGLVRDQKSRLRLGEEGEAEVAEYFGEKHAHSRTWNDQRDLWLVAKALGVDASKPGLRSALSRLDGLSAMVVQHAFGLSMRQALSPSKLRAALALVALERAFGDNVKEGLGKGTALSAKAGRVLAGQLLAKPRELPTDARLITALCADKVAQPRFDLAALRIAVLRSLADAPSAPTKIAPPAPKPPLRGISESLSQAPITLTPQVEVAAQRPGLAQFSAGVLNAARTSAEGWPGARKAFISRVWDAIRTSHPEWGLSEIEFKDMLAGAHRAGQLVLAGADLKNKQNIKEFEESAILYKNTVWHYVRVED
ncbi:hypothetical protein [Hyphomicrobium sp. NDB2Meth4]|uniref:hypothetical protein n=1 Tax=Hyphomicrobium sp. NDB2Meth4 TaxID=1892846 RepID=UPI000930C903|nr:hypothetical protein [Hyphomicrobium sp. NDB2Meth4]